MILGRLNHVELELIKRKENTDVFCDFTIGEMYENLTIISAEIPDMPILSKKKSSKRTIIRVSMH